MLLARLLALCLLFGTLPASAGTMYIDTAANGSASAEFSGSTDTTTAKEGGAAATITCSATTYTGSTPGCSLSGSPNLSDIITTLGATQDSIYLACATNTNQKIFWITAVDDGADLIQVSAAGSGNVTPTGCTAATSNWNIGGRAILTNASQEAALRAGDTLIFNTSPASSAATLWTFRNAGTSTDGFATFRGKTGVRPVLTTSAATGITSGSGLVWIENLEIVHTNAGGQAISAGGNGQVIVNVKISDAGSSGGINCSAACRVFKSEVSGSAGPGILISAISSVLILSGNYVHDNATSGISFTGTAPHALLIDNVVESNTLQGIIASGAVTSSNPGIHIVHNTITLNGDSGVEIADADLSVFLRNNIITENGNGANEYNVEFVAGSAQIAGVHEYNDFFHSNCQGSATGGTGTAGQCVLNLTVNATEISADPLMTNPGSGDFTLGASSPALSIGYPGQLLGATGLGYPDLGALQRQPSAGGGGSRCIGC